MLARRPWSRVLAEELGAGREKGSPRRAGPAGRDDARPCGIRAGPARGGGAPAAPALAALSLRFPARGEPQSPSWRPSPLASSGPCSRPPLFPHQFPVSRFSDAGRRWVGRWYFEAGNQMVGASGRDGGGAAGSPESWPRRRRAGGREARPGRQPRPAQTRGSKRCEGNPSSGLRLAQVASSSRPLCLQRTPHPRPSP